MNINKIIKTVVTFNRENFEKGFSTITRIQDQVVQKGAEIVEKNVPFAGLGKETAEQWLDVVRNGRELVRASVERGYRELENYLAVTK